VKRRTIVFGGALALTLPRPGLSTISAPDTLHTFHYENVLGTSLQLRVAAQSRDQARAASDAALAEIGRQAKILSTWDPRSEVSRWQRTNGQTVRVSPDLFRVLALYDRWRVRTGGAINPSAQAIIEVWQQASRENRLPSEEELAAAVAKTRESQWTLDRLSRTATRTGETPLVFAAMAKSYIIDRAADAAMRTGVAAAVVNIGGDIAVRGSHTETVDIANPHSPADNSRPIARVMVRNNAIATSGDYRRGVTIDGRHYSHIVDPRTGAPAQDVVSSTVIASNPADAGALATAFSVLKPAESAKLAASMPGVAYLLVKKNGEQVKNENWRAYEVAAVTKPAVSRAVFAPAASGALWDPSMELSIDFEIAHLPGMVRRPFIAAWIEDADRFQVKTIALWYHEDRFLTEMKSWYRSDRMRAMSEGKEIFRSIGAATRAPGKYSLQWDGKDNAGNTVKAGKYTVYLEVCREHGTHQMVKKEFDFDGKPDKVSFPGNIELTSASFDYHKLAGK
jgi:thiamine biosynthesis lipoprotein ApbE